MLVIVAVCLCVSLCRLYRSHRERAWLVVLVSVTFGLIVLIPPRLGEPAFVLAGHLVEWARIATPFLLLAMLVVVLLWFARRWSRTYRSFGPLGRARILLLSALIGLAIAALLRVVPVLPDAAGIAGEGARAGLEAGVRRSLDEAAERLNGGEAP